MNSGESSSGGDSKGAQENGAATSSECRPHKKARFPWQIKGKHHLKDQKQAETPANTNIPVKSASPEPVLCVPETRVNSYTLPETVIPFRSRMPLGQQTILEDELNKIDTFDHELRYTKTFNCKPMVLTDMPELPLETVVAIAENMLLEAGYKSDSDSSSTKTKPEHSRRESKRQAKRLRRQEERCIARWQSSQIVKGCFDNTINSVIQSWMNTPEAARDEESPLDFSHNDGPLIFNNDDIIENEGILMAINAHGLQNMGAVPFAAAVPAIEPLEGLADALASASPMFSESSSSSICSEDLQLYYEKTHYLWPDENVPQQPAEPEEFNFETYHRMKADYGCNDSLMDAAVIEAIKSKGLIKAGTDFG